MCWYDRLNALCFIHVAGVPVGRIVTAFEVNRDLELCIVCPIRLPRLIISIIDPIIPPAPRVHERVSWASNFILQSSEFLAFTAFVFPELLDVARGAFAALSRRLLLARSMFAAPWHFRGISAALSFAMVQESPKWLSKNTKRWSNNFTNGLRLRVSESTRLNVQVLATSLCGRCPNSLQDMTSRPCVDMHQRLPMDKLLHLTNKLSALASPADEASITDGAACSGTD